jgi:hypothetical protein
VVTDPVASLELAAQSNSAQLQALAAASTPDDPEQVLDGSASPLGLEQGQMSLMLQGGGAGGGGGGGGIGGIEVPFTTTTLAREYVWGPGDTPAGVDELLAQYAAAGGAGPGGAGGTGGSGGSGSGVPDEGRLKPWYVLQDDGGDVAALVDCAPPPPPPSGGGLSGVAQVAAQWTYDAYGSALTAESLAPHPPMHCGHKGLFLDRLDAGVAAGTAEIPRLVPYAHLVVQMRNRAYSPTLGRFYQQDPNATAMALIGASVYHGRGVGALVTAFGLEELYGDGANLHQYLGANTWTRRDCLGLSFGMAVAEFAAMAVLRGLRGGLEAVVDEYGANLEHDLDWASDWGQQDDWHSRGDNSWIGDVFYDGLVGGVTDALLDAVDPIGIRNWFSAGIIDTTITVTRTIFRTTRAGLRAIKVGHLHHAWPRYLARITGTCSVVGTKLGRLHIPFHNYASGRMKSILGCPAMRAPASQWTEWIRRQRRLGKTDLQIFKELRSALKTATKEFESKHGLTGLVDVVREAVDIARDALGD